MKTIVRRDLPETDEYMIEKRRLERRKERELKRKTGPKSKPKLKPPPRKSCCQKKEAASANVPLKFIDRWGGPILIFVYVCYFCFTAVWLSPKGLEVIIYLFYIAFLGGIWVVMITIFIMDRIWGID